MQFTFTNNAGSRVSVEAPDEERARVAAMYKLHGEPDQPWLPKVWTGKGLYKEGRP